MRLSFFFVVFSNVFFAHYFLVRFLLSAFHVFFPTVFPIMFGLASSIILPQVNSQPITKCEIAHRCVSDVLG